MTRSRHVLEKQQGDQPPTLLQFLSRIVRGRNSTSRKLLDRLDERVPAEAIAKRAGLHYLGEPSRSATPIDEEAVSNVFDWARETLGRTATMAQETVAHRRELLRGMAAIERRINDTQAQTARTLGQLISG